MRVLLAALLLLPVIAASAQSRGRSWELGPAWRLGHGGQLGPELRRVIPLSRRVDARVGGSMVWNISEPMFGGIYGWSGESDSRNSLYVASVGADLRFRLIDGRNVGLSLLNGIGLSATRWGVGSYTAWAPTDDASDAYTVVYDVYDPRRTTTVTPTFSVALGFRVGPALNLNLGAELYSDRTAELLGALRAGVLVGW